MTLDENEFAKLDAPLLKAFRNHYNHYRSMECLPLAQEGVEFLCRIDATRARNLALQAVSHSLRPQREVSMPHIVHVGVTTYCNLECPACPTGNSALGRGAFHLDFRTYQKVIDGIGDRLMLMLFWDWGEPLMHPRITDMIGLARDKEIHTIISTNGMAGDSVKRLSALVDAGLSYVVICVDGASQESHEKYRIGGNLERVLRTIRRLVSVRGSRRYPVIEFRSLATRYNEREFPQLLALAQDNGADVFSVKSLRPYDYRGTDVDGELAPLTDRFSRYRYGDAGTRSALNRCRDDGPLRCGKPLFAPTLNSDGILAFCSYARGQEEFFGDLAQQEFEALWSAPETLARKDHFLRNGGTSACTTCYFRSDHLPTMLYTVSLRPLPADIRLQRPMRSADFLREYQLAMRTSDT